MRFEQTFASKENLKSWQHHHDKTGDNLDILGNISSRLQREQPVSTNVIIWAVVPSSIEKVTKAIEMMENWLVLTTFLKNLKPLLVRFQKRNYSILITI